MPEHAGGIKMKKKIIMSFVLAAAMIVSLAFSGCGQNVMKEEEELLTAEQRAALNKESKDDIAAVPGSTGGFEEGATIGISLPWLGTQNWKEAETMFKEQLTAEGFNVIIEQADQEVETQQQQIQSLIDKGAKVIVVGPVDGSKLGSVLDKAKQSGIYVIGYDRLLENTSGVDGVVQFGSIKTGQLQAQALLEGLEKEKGNGPYNIELFGGGPSDPNAPNFFIGAMSVLQPKIDDGTINVISGQTDFETCATADWDNSKAQVRMESLLSEFYSDKEIQGVLSPNDGIARTVIIACENAGQAVPVVSGLDAETETVEWVWSGKQYSTVAKPTSALVSKTLEIIKSLKTGQGMPSTDVHTNNGTIDVAVYELPPVVVTKDNAKEAFINDPERYALLK